MNLLLLIVLGNARAAHDFFQYEDCGRTCTMQRTSCTISQENGDFVIKCCDSEECRAKQSNLVVCLSPGQPPMGGTDIWPDFKRRTYPPTPEPIAVETNCRIWQILCIVGWMLLIALGMICLLRIIFRREEPRTGRRRMDDDEDEVPSVVHNPNYIDID